MFNQLSTTTLQYIHIPKHINIITIFSSVISPTFHEYLNNSTDGKIKIMADKINKGIRTPAHFTHYINKDPKNSKLGKNSTFNK